MLLKRLKGVFKMADLSLGAAKGLYNTTQANEAEFIQTCVAKFKVDTQTAETMFKYMASMDIDKTPGLTSEEYQAGLMYSRELNEIKRDKILDQYVSKEERDDFYQLSQNEKLEHIKSKIPHEPDQDTEAHIMAQWVLTKLNRYDEEIKILNNALTVEEFSNKVEKTKKINEKRQIQEEQPQEKSQEKKPFNSLG